MKLVAGGHLEEKVLHWCPWLKGDRKTDEINTESISLGSGVRHLLFAASKTSSLKYLI